MSGLTIVHAERDDPIARVAMAQRTASQLHVLHLDDWLPHVEPRPWPEMLALHGGETDDSIAGRQVVNRLLNIAATKVGRTLAAGGRDERWLHAHLQPRFEHAASLAYDQGQRGVSRALLPLNAQWLLIQQSLATIRVPPFVYGFGFQPPDVAVLKQPMQKSIWSLFDWVQERHLPAAEAVRHQFFVERPIGTPVVAYFLGDVVGKPHYPRGAAALSADLDMDELREVCAAVRRAFRAEAGELLLFRERHGLVFHAFSPQLRSVQALPGFETDVLAWLEALSSIDGQAGRA